MSKFINEIEATILNDRRRVKPPEFDLLDVTQEMREDDYSSGHYTQEEYRVGVRFETRTWLGEREIAAGALDHIKKRMIAQMKDAVYGDLRKIIYKLERHLYERELYKAFDDLKEIYKEID